MYEPALNPRSTESSWILALEESSATALWAVLIHTSLLPKPNLALVLGSRANQTAIALADRVQLLVLGLRRLLIMVKTYTFQN